MVYRIGMEAENILETGIDKRCVMMFKEMSRKGERPMA
jgi:hypothetical protein